jgi:hypothetical protein
MPLGVLTVKLSKYEKEQAIYYGVLVALLVFNVTWILSEFA